MPPPLVQALRAHKVYAVTARPQQLPERPPVAVVVVIGLGNGVAHGHDAHGLRRPAARRQ
ncbi:hypothetical protein [Hymenobacter rubripertinctus]|uniref:hypothetical protein n=1 Tax=Hymenobacter rubripertinctus TaxID=2029981 RepID=UPI0016028900|nr:hypothetical protein [Hymenobacter rubripertinctus]